MMNNQQSSINMPTSSRFQLRITFKKNQANIIKQCGYCAGIHLKSPVF